MYVEFSKSRLNRTTRMQTRRPIVWCSQTDWKHWERRCAEWRLRIMSRKQHKVQEIIRNLLSSIDVEMYFRDHYNRPVTILRELGITTQEFALFKAIALFSPSIPQIGMTNQEIYLQMRWISARKAGNSSKVKGLSFCTYWIRLVHSQSRTSVINIMEGGTLVRHRRKLI